MSEPTPRQGVGRFEWEQAWRSTAKPGAVTPAVAAVGYAVATFATYSTGADARPALATLATAASVVRATAADALKALEALGWIECTGSPPGRPRTFRLTLPPGVTKPQGVTNPRAERVTNPRAGGDQITPLDLSLEVIPTPPTSIGSAQMQDVWALAEAEAEAAADWTPTLLRPT